MRSAVLIAAMTLAACNDLSPEEQAQRDARDVAMVERANDTMPPLEQITPEPIQFPDIERYDLDGTGCNYAPGTSLNTRIMAREVDAYAKIDGEMIRFAADPGARELPGNTRSLYSGREYSLRLRIDGEGTTADSGSTNYEGSITLFDAYDRVVFEGTGLAQCRE